MLLAISKDIRSVATVCVSRDLISLGVSSTRVGDHRGSARTVQFLIISLSSPHLRSARARAQGAEDLAKFRPVLPCYTRGVLWIWSSALGTWRGLSQISEYCGVVFCLVGTWRLEGEVGDPHTWTLWRTALRAGSGSALAAGSIPVRPFFLFLFSQYELADLAFCVYVAVLSLNMSSR